MEYPNCAGILVPPPPPPPPGAPAAKKSQPNVHAACPTRSEQHLTVSLPIRGEPKALMGSPNPQGRRVSLTGEVWTVVVEESSAGPSGSMWTQNAWLLIRNPSNGRLELADTILLGVVE